MTRFLKVLVIAAALSAGSLLLGCGGPSTVHVGVGVMYPGPWVGYPYPVGAYPPRVAGYPRY